jgi:hypothetical protein
MLAGYGCGGKDDDDDKDDSPTTPTAVTASFGTAGCSASTCHGTDGSATPVGATAGKGVLKGTSLSETAFKSAIRNGQGTTMVKYTEAQMSDADISSNYKFFTAK